MSFEKAKNHLQRFGADKNIIELSDSSATVELAAKAIGRKPEHIAKSIALKLDGNPILIIASGNAKIDNGKYRDKFKAKAKMLSRDEVSELIGHEVGGVCPFGINDGVTVYLDKSLLGFDKVYAAAGSSNSVVGLTCEELEKCSEYTEWVDVCKLPPAAKSAVIFDLDGTLLNTLEDLADSVNFALSRFEYPKRSLEEVCSFVGNGVAVLIELSIPQGKENPDFQSCLEIFREHYAHNMENKTAPYNGIVNMLKELKASGFKTAIVSNKFDLAVKGLSERFFGKLIDCAIGESEEIRRKPAPDSIYKALEDLNCEASNALYVGDSEVDCETVKNAKIDFAAVSWGFRSADVLKEKGAKLIFNTPQELADYILSLRTV